MSERISLFLLDTVLFPTMQLPLQVFEPRYLEMVRKCMDLSSVFGVNLIRSGPEVGGDAEPVAVGTTARILSAQPLQEGRLLLVTRGERRYRILRTDHSEAYLQAEVEYLEDETMVSDPSLSRRVFDRFREVLETMGLAIEFDESLLEQPARISYLVAAHLAKSNPDKQQLLEMDSLQTRLEVEERWVGEVLDGLRARKKVEEIAGRNGKIRRGERPKA